MIERLFVDLKIFKYTQFIQISVFREINMTAPHLPITSVERSCLFNLRYMYKENIAVQNFNAT